MLLLDTLRTYNFFIWILIKIAKLVFNALYAARNYVKRETIIKQLQTDRKKIQLVQEMAPGEMM